MILQSVIEYSVHAVEGMLMGKRSWKTQHGANTINWISRCHANVMLSHGIITNDDSVHVGMGMNDTGKYNVGQIRVVYLCNGYVDVHHSILSKQAEYLYYFLTC